MKIKECKKPNHPAKTKPKTWAEGKGLSKANKKKIRIIFAKGFVKLGNSEQDYN